MSKLAYPEWILNVLFNRCVTCLHWDGDRAEVFKNFEQHPKSIDLDQGWGGSGACAKDYDWGEFEIDGDAAVRLKVEAGFGCVLHKRISTKPSD